MTSSARDALEAKSFDRFGSDVFDGFFYRIGCVDQPQVGIGDHPSLCHCSDEMEQFLPIIGPHDHDRKVVDLRGLNKRERFEQLVECARAPWHNHKGVGIFNQQCLADVKIMQSDAAIEVRICRLLRRELYRAPNGTATNFFRAAVRRFHNSRTTAGNNGKPEARNGCAHFPGQLIMRIVAPNPRRAKHSYTWTDEMERTKSAQKIAHHSQKREKFGKPRARSFKKNFIRTFRRSNLRRTHRTERLSNRIVPVLHENLTKPGAPAGAKLDTRFSGWRRCDRKTMLPAERSAQTVKKRHLRRF